jgi:hypothetical protein
LIPAGQIIVMRGEVESIQDPDWWNQDTLMAVMDHVCEKMVSSLDSPVLASFSVNNWVFRDVTLVLRPSLAAL